MVRATKPSVRGVTYKLCAILPSKAPVDPVITLSISLLASIV